MSATRSQLPGPYDLDVERDLPRSWWAEGEDDSLPDDADDGSKWALVRAAAVPPHRALSIAADHHLGSQRPAQASAVDALLAVVLPSDKATLTVPEAGTVLGLGEASSYAAARRGELPVLRFGKRVVVPIPALRHLLENPPMEAIERDSGASGPRRVRPTSLQNRRGPVRVIPQ